MSGCVEHPLIHICCKVSTALRSKSHEDAGAPGVFVFVFVFVRVCAGVSMSRSVCLSVCHTPSRCVFFLSVNFPPPPRCATSVT